MECTDLLSVIFLNYKIMNIKLEFNKGDHVKFYSCGDLICGYIVGFMWTGHCYLKKPILYAILEEEYYENYKKSIDKNESPFNFYFRWRPSNKIRLIN